MDEVMLRGLSFGSLFSLVMGLSHLLRPRKRLNNYFMALLFLAGTIVFACVYWNKAGIFFSPGFLNHLYLPWIFGLGPGMYLLFRATLDDEYRPSRREWLFFAPALSLALVQAPVGLLFPALFASTPMDYFRGGGLTWIELAMVLGFSLNGVFYVVIWKQSSVVFNHRALREERSARVLLIVLVGSGLLTLYVVWAYIARDAEHLFLAAFITTVFSVFNFVFGQRSPELFQALSRAMDQARYANSRLEGVDLEKLRADLTRGMEQEQLFMEDDLTLAKLAEELDVKSYQLSEFLNNHLGMNFSRFVNGYRIEEARRIFREEPDANILSVGLQVGFSSKATFNGAFKAIAGMTPREYIQANRT